MNPTIESVNPPKLSVRVSAPTLPSVHWKNAGGAHSGLCRSHPRSTLGYRHKVDWVTPAKTGARFLRARTVLVKAEQLSAGTGGGGGGGGWAVRSPAALMSSNWPPRSNNYFSGVLSMKAEIYAVLKKMSQLFVICKSITCKQPAASGPKTRRFTTFPLNILKGKERTMEQNVTQPSDRSPRWLFRRPFVPSQSALTIQSN